MSRPTTLRGRPAATSHAEIEREAFALFAANGFDATTLDAIAERIGVARRTVTRYYPSKNDIPWGQFDRTLADFRELLDTMPASLPLWERVHRGVVEFNSFSPTAEPTHRTRMSLLLRTPTLLAHSVLRYQQWRSVIASYVATQTGLDPTDRLPRLVSNVSLALAMSAYDDWLSTTPPPETTDDGQLLRSMLERTMTDLRGYLDGPTERANELT